MPAIKITLSRLIELFGKSVNTVELPAPVRALAARLMTLTAHVIRIDQKVDAQIKQLSEQVSTLTDIIQALAQAQTEGVPTAPAPSVPPAPSNEAPPAEAAEEETEEEAEERDFFARAQEEAAAEVAAINANLPPEPASEPRSAPVAVLPRGKKAGGAK